MFNPLQAIMGLFGGNGGIGQLLGMFNGGMHPQNIITTLMQSNPQMKQAWPKVQEIVKGKSPDQLKEMVSNMAKERGTSLEEIKKTVSQFGIKLPL